MAEIAFKKVHFSFQEILDAEDYVICDSSIRNALIKEIYPVKTFSNLDVDILHKSIESSSIFLSLLEDPNSLTTRGVIEEIETARDIIANQLRYLVQNSSNGKKKYGERDKHKSGMLRQVQELHHQSYKVAKKSLFIPGNRQIYGFLERVVIAVAEMTEAKIDYSYLYGEQKAPKKDNHTDEQLVSAALYLSAVDRKSGAILTKDSDIKRIVRHTLHYLYNSANNGYREIARLVKDHPVKVYQPEGPIHARLIWDSSWLERNGVPNFVSLDRIKSLDEMLS